MRTQGGKLMSLGPKLWEEISPYLDRALEMVGKTKGPILRGLAARAPYFHNGSAATLHDVVDFYDQRSQLNLTEQQKHDLVAFLQTL